MARFRTVAVAAAFVLTVPFVAVVPAAAGGTTAEVVEARIWGGVHFRSADEDGGRLGEAVSRYILAREFRPRR